MTDVQLDLPWWPPPDGEPIGEARARELVAALRAIAPPVVEAAAADLQARLDPGTEVVRSGAPASYIARFAFDDPQVRSLCVGTVYQAKGNPGAMNSIQLHRDGMLRWRRDRYPHARGTGSADRWAPPPATNRCHG